MTPPLTIGITDCSKYDIYHRWVQLNDPSLGLIRLSSVNENINDVERCHGVLLTGGEDVHPRFYHKPEYLEFCYPDDISEQRDEFEFEVLQLTQRYRIPLLGICRGLQIANVFFGGTLIPHLPAWGKEGHAKRSDGTDGIHPIKTADRFSKALPDQVYEVNSNHHQAIENVAEPLVITAYSIDGVAEAARSKDVNGPYLNLVQWHPERMENQNSVMSMGVLSEFVEASKAYMQAAV